jgi:hypothetical protein
MNPLLILVSITQSVAQALAANQKNPGKVAEYTGYLNLAADLAARWTEGNTALVELDDQLKEAVAAKRGLTPEQRAAWRARDDLATEVARDWLAEHQKGNKP